MTPTLDRDGYTILRGAVPLPAVHAAVRRLNLAIREEGLTAEQITEWQHRGFFPHLRETAVMWELLGTARPTRIRDAVELRPGDSWAEPQLHLRFPDRAQDIPLTPHIDEVPPWVLGRTYRGIVGVSLTDCGPDDGAVAVWPGSHLPGCYIDSDHDWQPGDECANCGALTSDPVPVPLAAGDAIVMHPKLAHAGTLNLGHAVRMAVYFRLLAGAS